MKLLIQLLSKALIVNYCLRRSKNNETRDKRLSLIKAERLLPFHLQATLKKDCITYHMELIIINLEKDNM